MGALLALARPLLVELVQPVGRERALAVLLGGPRLDTKPLNPRRGEFGDVPLGGDVPVRLAPLSGKGPVLRGYPSVLGAGIRVNGRPRHSVSVVRLDDLDSVESYDERDPGRELEEPDSGPVRSCGAHVRMGEFAEFPDQVRECDVSAVVHIHVDPDDPY